MIFRKSIEFEFPKQIAVSGKSYFVEVSFSRKKSSSANIKENKLIFRLSSYLSNKNKLLHFEDLLKKLIKRIESSSQINIGKDFNQVYDEGKFYFSNELYLIELTNKYKNIKLLNNIFYVNLSLNKEDVKKKIIKLLCKKYYVRLNNYVSQLNFETYNYLITGFELKSLDSKWGHCTSDNKILLNLKLLNCEPEILNYVIFHEISHIKHKNHSQRFWNEVGRFCPNYKVLRKRLKDNPPGVFV